MKTFLGVLDHKNAFDNAILENLECLPDGNSLGLVLDWIRSDGVSKVDLEWVLCPRTHMTLLDHPHLANSITRTYWAVPIGEGVGARIWLESEKPTREIPPCNAFARGLKHPPIILQDDEIVQ
jgi:hypothetical protein